MKSCRFSIMANLLFLIRKWFSWDPKGTVWALSQIPIALLSPLVSAYTTKLLVDIVTVGIQLDKIFLIMAGITVINLSLSLLNECIESKMAYYQYNISFHYAMEMLSKLLYMDYAQLESYKGRSQFERCKKFAFEGAQTDGAWAIVRMIGLVTSVLGITTYTVIFGFISEWILLSIVTTCVMQFAISLRINKIASACEDGMVNSEMKFYYFYKLATNPSAAKDIRLTHAQRWLIAHMSRAAEVYTQIMSHYTKTTTKLTGYQAILSMLRDFSIFITLILHTLSGNVGIGDFLFYFGLLTGFASWMNNVAGHISSLTRIAHECQKYRDYLELPDQRTSLEIDNSLREIDSIEFQDVSFEYDDGSVALQHVNFKVKRNENVAIVGRNGAGKTTLIKLMCGLYSPSSGRILINGKDIVTLSRSQLFSMVSAIFQDSLIQPISVLENITMGARLDEKRIVHVLEEVGLYEKLAHQLNAMMISHVHEGGLDLSGGETQRLLLARALYKDAQILILDEPTAALDPVAEKNLYLKYHDITKDRISFYISHRLASTRFCDHILYIENGQIIESGTHEALLKKRGAYWKMYETQSVYYRKEIKNNVVSGS